MLDFIFIITLLVISLVIDAHPPIVYDIYTMHHAGNEGGEGRVGLGWVG